METGPNTSPRPSAKGYVLASLRHRLLLLVLLAVLPVLALLLATAWEQRRQAADAAKEDALRLARLASSQHERLVEGARSLLVGLAQLSDVQLQSSPACSALFAEVQRRFPLYRDIGAIRPDGRVSCAARLREGAGNVADQPDFRQALTSRAFAASGYRPDGATGPPVLVLSYPALDRAGAVRALVFAELDLGWVSQLAVRAALPDGSVVSVTDGGSLLLARYPDIGRGVGKLAPEPRVVGAIQRGDTEGTLESAGSDQTQRLYAFTALGGAPRPQPLYVTVGIPRRAALAEADRL